MKNFLINLGLLLLAVGAIYMWVVLSWPAALVLVGVLLLWMFLTRSGRQASSVTAVGVRTLPQRIGASLVIVIGIAGVVGVLVALFAMAAGFQATLKNSGSDDTAIVLRGGSQAELNSVLGREDVNVISQAPGVARDGDGKAIVSPELVVVANLPKKSDPTIDANVQIRGVGDQAWKLQPSVKITDGRRFKPGLRELVVGKGARAQFVGLDVGRTLKLSGQEWTIVGAFESGDSHDSELWGDTETVGGAYRRGSSVQSVTVKLQDPAAFDKFKAALASDPRVKVDVSTTRDYYASQSEQMTKTLRIVGIVVGVIMAIGALFGALNTMFAAVATRAREIATLRALGFRGLPVVVSVMLETLLLALAGGILGGLITWLIFNGYTASTLGSNFSQVVFQFKVSPDVLWTGIKWALAIGFIGGLFPAVRAARLPVTTALRES